jgi:hypothetical protein
MEIPTKLRECQYRFDQACNERLQSLHIACERVAKLFAEQFESNYSSLRSLGLKIDPTKFADVSNSFSQTQFSAAGDFLKASAAARGRIGAGIGAATGCLGAPAGAIVGALCGVLGGCALGNGSAEGGFIGLLVGGALGFVIAIVGGGLVGAKVGATMSDFEKERKEVGSLLLPEIQNHFHVQTTSRREALEKVKRTVLELLDRGVEEHSIRYSEAVSKLLQEHELKMASVKQQRMQAEVDSTELLKRIQYVDEVRSKLALVRS